MKFVFMVLSTVSNGEENAMKIKNTNRAAVEQRVEADRAGLSWFVRGARTHASPRSAA